MAHADGRVRMWNAIPSSGALLCDFHAGHGQARACCASRPTRATRMVTADSAGRCRLWDVAGLVRRIHSQSAAAGEDEPPFGRSDVELLGYWQAHSSGKCVNAARWLEVEGIGVFFTTAGDDCAVHLWSRDGQHVGEFGPHRWTLEDTRTWANTELPPDGDFPRAVTDEDGTPDPLTRSRTLPTTRTIPATRTRRATSRRGGRRGEGRGARRRRRGNHAVPRPGKGRQ